MEVDVNVFHQASGEDVKMKNLPASLLDLDMYRRLVYQEENGAEVVLDFSEEEVSMIRRGESVTQALFSLKTPSYMHLHSEQGTLSFQVEIEEMVQKSNSLSILYALYHENQEVSQNTYECEWIGGE